MTFEHVAPLVRAILYEGFSLYPYRASAPKNQERWLLGSLAPRAYAEALAGSERWRLRVEILARAEPSASLRIEASGLGEVEEHWALPEQTLDALSRWTPERRGAQVERDGIELVARAIRLERRLHRIEIELRNLRPVDLDAEARRGRPSPAVRAEMKRLSLGSAHVLVGARGAELISSIEPPPDLVQHAAACVNEGCYPVLVGARERSDTVLAAPIALGDYPRIAPESPGDFFDATEMDEMLALRIQTLTDAEKEEMRAGPAAAVLERTEQLSQGEMFALRGRLARAPSAVELGGRSLVSGDRVRLRPRGRADAMDLALAERVATIASIEQEIDGAILLAVTVDDDPGADLGRRGWPGHRFFFRLDEVEPLS